MRTFSFLKHIKLKNMMMLSPAGIVNAFGITVFLNPVVFTTAVSPAHLCCRC